MNKNKVLVALSGGIDSSIAAFLLKQQGFEVIGLTFINYIENPNDPSEFQFVRDAQKIAHLLNIKLIVVDIRKNFKKNIINYFVNEYLNGHTPNPCALCNQLIKWPTFLHYADLENAFYIATGHYAILKSKLGRFFLSKAADQDKDQTYFLYRLPQSYLKRSLFPLGNLTKTQVKNIAKKLNLNFLTQKSESYDICFIKNQNYQLFLSKLFARSNIHVPKGKFIDPKGKTLGFHDGIPFYTVGQRKGLLIPSHSPLFVKKIDPHNKNITVAPKNSIKFSKAIISNLNLQKFSFLPPQGTELIVKIRYRDPGRKAIIRPLEQNQAEITFLSPVTDIAPGQSAVFYDNNDLIGGGIIVSYH